MSSYFITLDEFRKCFPACKNPVDWFNAFSKILPAENITQKNQVLCFLAQCAHESGSFNTLRENFNYSAEGLLKIFPKYFNATTAAQYARKPDLIASLVYANRMGNGAADTHEGFKYRGVGIIQVTGKDNLTRCSKALFGDLRLLDNPELLLDKENAVRSACWFWTTNNLNRFTDPIDMVALTKGINGGKIGLKERIDLLTQIQSIVK